MPRNSPLLALQYGPQDISHYSYGSQTTSSTLSDLVPNSILRVMHLEGRTNREGPSLPNTRGPRRQRPTQERHEAPGLFSPPRLETGDLSRSEAWWRDRYYSITDGGYRLRHRYHPRWKPSWIRSGKDSCETEDGQHCQVRVCPLARVELTLIFRTACLAACCD